MFRPVVDMERILTEENNIYTCLYDLEREKSEALIKKDWENLEKLSIEQDKLFSKLELIEKEREQLIDEYSRMNNLDDLQREITLKDIVLSMDEDSSHHLLELGMELKNIMMKTEGLVRTNEKILNDNMEFFNILISGLKNRTAINEGYGKDGREENRKAADSLLFNRTV